MGGIHKKVKKYSPGANLERAVVGEKTFDDVHFIGTQMEKQYDATKAAEQAAKDEANKPVIPLPDEEEIKRQKRRGSRGGGRASTILTGGSQDRLGP